MSKIQIITDSASDISKEMEQKYNLDVISYSIVIGDKTYTSRVDFDNEGCYELMEAEREPSYDITDHSIPVYGIIL